MNAQTNPYELSTAHPSGQRMLKKEWPSIAATANAISAIAFLVEVLLMIAGLFQGWILTRVFGRNVPLGEWLSLTFFFTSAIGTILALTALLTGNAFNRSVGLLLFVVQLILLLLTVDWMARVGIKYIVEWIAL